MENICETKSPSIADLMLHDHNLIERHMATLKIAVKTNTDEIKHVFDRLHWALEKHFLIEEKAVFALLADKQQFSYILLTLISEHEEMLNVLKQIKSSIIEGNILMVLDLIDQLATMVAKHGAYEDNEFYPLLDMGLNEFEQQRIYEMICAFRK